MPKSCYVCQQPIEDTSLDAIRGPGLHPACAMRAERAGSLPCKDPDPMAGHADCCGVPVVTTAMPGDPRPLAGFDSQGRALVHAGWTPALDDLNAATPLTDEQVTRLVDEFPVAETAAEQWIADRLRHVVLTLRAEQERHRETKWEWEQALERERYLADAVKVHAGFAIPPSLARAMGATDEHTQKGAASDRQAVHGTEAEAAPDAKRCPRCTGTLTDVIAKDGSCVEAEACASCGGRWWFDPPRSLGAAIRAAQAEMATGPEHERVIARRNREIAASLRGDTAPAAITPAGAVDLEAIEARVQAEALALRGKGESVLDAYLDEDLSWMDREGAIAHYRCAVANWALTLDGQDLLRAEVRSLRETVRELQHASEFNRQHVLAVNAECERLRAAIEASIGVLEGGNEIGGAGLRAAALIVLTDLRKARRDA